MLNSKFIKIPACVAFLLLYNCHFAMAETTSVTPTCPVGTTLVRTPGTGAAKYYCTAPITCPTGMTLETSYTYAGHCLTKAAAICPTGTNPSSVSGVWVCSGPTQK